MRSRNLNWHDNDANGVTCETYPVLIWRWNMNYCLQTIAGFAQSTGWPGVVTAVGNWFGKGKRGNIIVINSLTKRSPRFSFVRLFRSDFWNMEFPYLRWQYSWIANCWSLRWKWLGIVFYYSRSYYGNYGLHHFSISGYWPSVCRMFASWPSWR